MVALCTGAVKASAALRRPRATRAAPGLDGVGALVVAVACLAWQQLPGIGAGALLHPARHTPSRRPPDGCTTATFAGAAVTLRGWDCAPVPTNGADSRLARGSIVYLHGVADNRDGAAGVVSRFQRRGYRVVAYDSRAHGESEGTACTYGYFEKEDLRRVIDALSPGPVVLIGQSLGAAVALQEAADDRRVVTVVAAETFADLRTVATERAPFIFTRGTIDRAFALAEHEAHFKVDDVSPVRAAERIAVPVLLIHGDADVDTPPNHSERVRAALRTRSKLILVPGARHNESLRSAGVWSEIEAWLEQVNSAKFVSQRPRETRE